MISKKYSGDKRDCSSCNAIMEVFWNPRSRKRPLNLTKDSGFEFTRNGWWLHKCNKCGYEEHEIEP